MAKAYHFRVLICCLVSVLLSLVFPSQSTGNSAKDDHFNSDTNAEVKQNAFVVLQEQCNSCHRKQNPFKVFKKGNMERHAAAIYEQVFVLKLMPQEGVELSATDREVLLAWLKTQNLPESK